MERSAKRQRRRLIATKVYEDIEGFMLEMETDEETTLKRTEKVVELEIQDVNSIDYESDNSIDSEEVIGFRKVDGFIKNIDQLQIQLRVLVLKYQLSNQCVSDLLQILRKYGLDLPATKEEIIQTSDTDLLLNTNIQKLGTKCETTKLFIQPIEKSTAFNGPVSSLNSIRYRNELKNPEFIFIAKKLEAISKDIKEIKKNVQLHADNFNFKFPLENEEELNKMENLINNEDEANKVIQYLERFMPVDNNSSCGLTNVINDDLLFPMNWDGVKGKKPLKAYKLFKHILYESWANFFPRYSEFEKSIKKQISDSHNRVHRKKHREKMANGMGE